MIVGKLEIKKTVATYQNFIDIDIQLSLLDRESDIDYISLFDIKRAIQNVMGCSWSSIQLGYFIMFKDDIRITIEIKEELKK